MRSFNRHVRRALLVLGLLGLASQAFAWSNDPYYVGVFQGNALGDVSKGPMLLIPNGGGAEGTATCVNIFILSEGEVKACGACLVNPDEASRTSLSEMRLLQGTAIGVIKIIASAPVDGRCDASSFGYAQDAQNHLLPEVCDGDAVSGACKSISKTVAADPSEYLKLMRDCTASNTFVQARCQDP